MDYQADLNRLENIVEKVLVGYNDLKDKKTELEGIVTEQEGAIRRLEAEISTLREERTLILQRVSTLIATIEDWENTSVQQMEEKPPLS